MKFFFFGITMRFLFIPAILLFSAQVWAQDPACGLFNNKAIHVAPHYAQPSESRYDGSQLAPPATVGGTYVDPIFGCSIERLTNGPVQFGQPARHEYGSISAINSDDTLIELGAGPWFITDLSGNIIVPQGSVPWGGGIGARWDPTNPKVAYYVASGTNSLIKATINTSNCAPRCTISTVTQHTFPEYTSITLGGGEGDMQPDHILLSGTLASNATQEFFVYTISTGTKGPAFNAGSHDFDNVQLTASNQMVVNWGVDQKPLGSCSTSPCYTGFELFGTACTNTGCSPGSASFVRHLSDTRSHSVESRDANGNDVVVAFDAYPRFCANGGLITIKVADGTVTCIVNMLPWVSTAHLGSSRLLSGTNWIVLSSEDSDGPGAASYPLAANWNLPMVTNNNPAPTGYWGYLTNEVDLISLDGSKIYRLVHHRSRPGASDYWKSSRACLSRDGKYVVYDSDYGMGQNTPVTDYTDVYLINTGVAGSASVAPQPPTNLKVVVQ
jgi:hypothetical protein